MQTAATRDMRGDRQVLEERVRALRLPAPAKGAATSRWPWAICLFFIGLFVWQTYLRTTYPEPTVSKTDAVVAEKSDASVPSVNNQRQTSGDVVLESKGHLIPAHQVLVSPKVSGMIVELFVAEGRRVTKGEVLAVIEKMNYETDRDRSHAALLKAEANRDRAAARVREAERGFRELEKQQSEAELAEAQTEMKRLSADQQRNVELKSKNAISAKDFDEANAKYLGMKQRVLRLEAALALMREGEREERKAMAGNELQHAEADVLQAKADLSKAQWQLDNCTIKSPITGTILKKNAEEGNIVNPIAFNGSFSLCDLADLSDLEIELNIGERDISVIYVGQRCSVKSDAYPERHYEAVVDRLMPIADRAKASIPIRVKVKVPTEEEGVYLKPEMGVNVTFFKRPDAAVSGAAEKPAQAEASPEAGKSLPGK